MTDWEVVGWDLDSTVFDTFHRQHMIPEIKAGRRTWEDYSAACTGDTPVPGVIETMNLMRGVVHIGISGRSQSALDLTWEVIHRCGIPLSGLTLREDGSSQPNAEFKVEKIRELESKGHRFHLFVEDWPPVAEYIRKNTLVPVLVLNPCYPETEETRLLEEASSIFTEMSDSCVNIPGSEQWLKCFSRWNSRNASGV
jgi:hypothetical protein